MSKLLRIFCAYANKVLSVRSALFWIRIIAETRYLLFSCNQNMDNKSPPAASNTMAESTRDGLLKHGLARSQWFSTMSCEMVNYCGKMVLLSYQAMTQNYPPLTRKHSAELNYYVNAFYRHNHAC